MSNAGIDTNMLLDACEMAVKKALSLGAHDVEAYASYSKHTSVFLESNDIKHVKVNEPNGIGIRVIYDKRVGFASINSLRHESIEYAIDNALSIAKASKRDKHNILAEPVNVKMLSSIYDKSVESLSIDDVVNYARDMLNTAKGYDPRVSVDSGVFEASVLIHAIHTSTGISLHERISILSYSIMGMARDGSMVSNFDVQSNASHMLKGTDANINNVALNFAKNVVNTLNSKGCESFKGQMVLAPNATIDIIKEPIVFSVNAYNVLRRASRFTDMLGKEVASSNLSIIDDATFTDGINASSFDREGFACKRNVIVDKGILKTFLHNTYTASKLKVNSTGNASGSINTPPLIDSTNFIIEAGDISYDEMIKEVKHGVIINRFSGNVNYVDGNFSGVVKGGYLVEHGEIKHPVREVMVAGNVFDAIKSISMLSKERLLVVDSLLPYIVIDNVSFTG